ncbi:phage protein [Moellerella wisconsensis]|nr:phage protein [Moellerella wisconsensis]
MMSLERKGDAQDMRSRASSANNNLCGVTSVNSVTNFHSRTQVRASLRNGRFVYEIKVPDGYEETNYKFVEWLVDDMNQKVQAVNA